MQEYHTTDVWNEEMWNNAEPIYYHAFPEEGRKTRAIIRRMFEKGMCHLHTVTESRETIAMALTGINNNDRVLILDYIAVREDHQSKGYGKRFMNYIKNWAKTEAACVGVVVEVEAESTPDNIRRIQFWETCGFQLTEYVHHYIWVPEPYRAMYMNITKKGILTEDGEKIFHYITQFHKKAYSK
jgi:GNAT superfamily N-acetyltransferase